MVSLGDLFSDLWCACAYVRPSRIQTTERSSAEVTKAPCVLTWSTGAPSPGRACIACFAQAHGEFHPVRAVPHRGSSIFEC